MSNNKTPTEHPQPSDSLVGGYGKPPRDRQFKKGTSGNPSGRPMGSLNLRTALEHQLRRRVKIREGDRERVVTVFDVMVMSMIKAAGRGNLKAIERILGIVSTPQTLSDSMRGRPVFEFTPEEAERFSKANLLRDMALLEDKVGDADDGKVVL